jgi:hypothetical protein
MNKCNIGIAILFLISMVILTIITACSPNISGSKILSREQVKGHDIVTLKVTFFDDENRVESPVATLTSGVLDQQPYIQEFRDMVYKSKGISIDSDNKFSPVSDSSHHIEAIFDNDHILDFYYSQEDNWLIWSNILDEDGQKIVEYHFLSPEEPIEDWLKTIEPLSVVEE